jgi:DUF4097 and DUF4098 domain-containing protein YvlB
MRAAEHRQSIGTTNTKRTRTMPHWDFPGSDPIDASVDLASGRVTLNAGPVSATTVEVAPSRFSRNAEKLIDEVRVAFDHGKLEVAGPRRTGMFRGHAAFDVTITLPEGSRCRGRTASADLTTTGELAALDAHTASGDITVAKVTGHLQAESSSGDARVDETGTAEIRTASGDVRLTWARDDVSVRTASGDVTIARADRDVAGTTASGDFRVSSVARGSTEISTASGDVVVGVNSGVGVYLDLSSATGSAFSQLEETGPSDDIALGVRCRTASGDIRIVRAAAEPAKAADAAAVEPRPAE